MPKRKKLVFNIEKGKKGFVKRSVELSNKKVSTYMTSGEHEHFKKAIKGKYRITEFIRQAIQEKLERENLIK